MSDTHKAIEAVWRIESARLIAGLTRIVRDVGVAEELAQDALIIALEKWPESGVPDNPGAWLMATAKHRAIDYFRQSGVTILLVEQNAELALELATRGYVIETGSIVLADTSERLLENPKVWASYLGEQDWEFEAAEVAQSPQ